MCRVNYLDYVVANQLHKSTRPGHCSMGRHNEYKQKLRVNKQ